MTLYNCRIEQIPNHVFVSLLELVHLNLSNNKIGKENENRIVHLVFFLI